MSDYVRDLNLCIERLAAERDALRAELAAAKDDEHRKWIKALLKVLPEEKAVLFREICVARAKLEAEGD